MRLLSVVLCAVLAACAGRATVAVTHVPDLVYVAPGVHVIADYDEPIFYADGFYWWFYEGAWYRSTYYTGGWTFAASPPIVVVRIGEPYRYRHYRPASYIVHHRPVPMRQVKRPVVRDHRADATRIRDHRRK